MMKTQEGMVILTLIGSGVLLWLAPTLSRPGVFFGVTVRPDFRDTDVARACLRRYRTVLVIGAVAAAAAVPTLSPRTKVLALLAHTAVTFAAWVWVRRAVMRYAEPLPQVRSAAITPRATSVPGGALTLAGPFLIVAFAALFIYAHWADIPDQIPSMQRGSAGRLTTKSVTTVFGPFAFVAALLVAFTMQTMFLLRRTRQIAAAGPSFEAEARFKRRTVQQSLAATYLMASGPSWFAAQRVLGSDDEQVPGVGFGDIWLAAILVLTVVVTVWVIRVGQGGQRQVPPTAARSGDATPDNAWKGGLLYFNPADPAVFVEKRMGVGWSLNFGNIWSRVFLAFAVGAPMLVLRLMR
ncbi:MAG: hypothetical protein IT183_10315 [Acidobacteria bacterium]|nr:hypothetical protein [Acidobacteriota bacterium]